MRKKVVLSCEKCGSRNYTTMSKKEAEVRLSLRKYCNACKTQTIHRETK